MRFNISATSNAEYDSEDYFTAERQFNTESLGVALENLELFLRSVGFHFGRLEVVNEDHLNPDELINTEEYQRAWVNNG